MGRRRPRVVHLLGGERREVAAPLVGLEQDLVREHVELLLRLALHVDGIERAMAVGERALAHAGADALAGAGDRLEEQAQIRVDEVLVALPGDEELGEGDAAHGAHSKGYGPAGARRKAPAGAHTTPPRAGLPPAARTPEPCRRRAKARPSPAESASGCR